MGTSRSRIRRWSRKSLTNCLPLPPGHVVSGPACHSPQRASTSPRSGVCNRRFNSKPVPYHTFNCWGAPKHRNWPEHWMAMREQRASASSMECVVRITALASFLCAILWITSHMCRRATGSIPADGSSRKTTSGSPTMAIAAESFLLFPPLNWPARECVNSVKLNVWSRSATSAFKAGPVIPLICAYNSMCSRTVMRSSSASNCGQ
mmetsp:Transcript_35039/g.81316  ORF Transcript_35039/g.81316 Transcript_35039/m.81316 type:complete len:206 (-) Transcript_35039:2072-2689(-)